MIFGIVFHKGRHGCHGGREAAGMVVVVLRRCAEARVRVTIEAAGGGVVEVELDVVVEHCRGEEDIVDDILGLDIAVEGDDGLGRVGVHHSWGGELFCCRGGRC